MSNKLTPWSDEYFIDKIERVIKNEIDMKYLVHENRKPTREEYERYFSLYVSRLSCVVTNFDLGIYEW